MIDCKYVKPAPNILLLYIFVVVIYIFGTGGM